MHYTAVVDKHLDITSHNFRRMDFCNVCGIKNRLLIMLKLTQKICMTACDIASYLANLEEILNQIK